LAQAPPVGSWDFVMKGSENGVAQVTFLADGSLTGTAAFTYFGKQTVVTNRHGVYTNLMGAAELSGSWAYYRTNRIMGFINEVAYSSSTNRVTNALSFHAVVKPARTTMAAYGSQGTATLIGIPLLATNDVSGRYHGTVRQRGLPYNLVEICDLTPADVNTYDVTGGGPGYAYTGTFLVSRQRYAAFYQTRGQTPGDTLIAVYAGPFNLAKAKGSFMGSDGVHTATIYRMEQAVP
jgi:hypothetical protein